MRPASKVNLTTPRLEHGNTTKVQQTSKHESQWDISMRNGSLELTAAMLHTRFPKRDHVQGLMETHGEEERENTS